MFYYGINILNVTTLLHSHKNNNLSQIQCCLFSKRRQMTVVVYNIELASWIWK